MRLTCILCLAIASCTIGGTAPAATSLPQHVMPSELLDRQDPGADTSRNAVLSRSVAWYPSSNAALKVGFELAALVFQNR